MALLWLVLGAAVLVFFLDRLIERMYRYKIEPHHIAPAKYGIAFEEVRFPGPKHAQLYGWWIPGEVHAPVLILVHGWSRNLSRVMPYIRALHPMGYNLLAFDARNHGSSSPAKNPTIGTFTEDVLAAIDYVVAEHAEEQPGVGIVGLSIGGGAAINAAGQDGRVRAVISVGAIAHPVEIMSYEFDKRHVPRFIAWLLLSYMRLRFGIDFNAIAPVKNIAKAEARILLVHGENDATVPLVQARELSEAAAPGKAELWVVPGKGHSDCHTHSDFWGRVAAFLEAAFSGG